jgi:hypothetical protein
MDINEINALINLLDDPDSNVYNAIRNKLTHLGAPVIPHIE